MIFKNFIAVLLAAPTLVFPNNDLKVQVNIEGKSDRIKALDTAALHGGRVFLTTVDGYKFNESYTIVSAKSVEGKFAGVKTDNMLINPHLSYDKRHVFLTVNTAIRRAAVTPNECMVARELDGIVNPNRRQNELLNEIVNLSIPEAQKALDSLAGQQYTNELIINQGSNREFIRRLYDPLRSIVTSDWYWTCPGLNAWAEGGGKFSSLKGGCHSYGFNLRGFEITGGVQKSLCNGLTFGAAGSYDEGFIDYKRGGGSDTAKTWLVGLYGLYRPCRFYGLADLAYGYSSNHMHRKISIGPSRSLRSNPKNSQITFYAEAGCDLRIRNILIQPFAGLEASSYWRNSFYEQGRSGWELNMQKKSQANASSRLGLHLTAKRLPYGVAASLDLAWDRRLTSSHNTLNERFIQFGNTFAIDGINLNRNSMDWALTFSKYVDQDCRIYLEGSGEWVKRYQSYNVLLGYQCNI